MKNIFASLLLLLVIAGGACKKGKNTSPDIQMSAYVNNRPWVSYSSNVSIERSKVMHIVIAADSSNTHMKIDIGNYKGAGTYSLSDSANAAHYISYSKTGGNITHKATSGTIIVTNNTSNGTTTNGIKGTFEFLADTVSITTGKFDVKLDLN